MVFSNCPHQSVGSTSPVMGDGDCDTASSYAADRGKNILAVAAGVRTRSHCQVRPTWTGPNPAPFKRRSCGFAPVPELSPSQGSGEITTRSGSGKHCGTVGQHPRVWTPGKKTPRLTHQETPTTSAIVQRADGPGERVRSGAPGRAPEPGKPGADLPTGAQPRSTMGPRSGRADRGPRIKHGVTTREQAARAPTGPDQGPTDQARRTQGPRTRTQDAGTDQELRPGTKNYD